MSVLDERRLNRATLQRQLLLEREQIGVVEAVDRIVGLQAQEPAAPYLALWNRVCDLELSAVDRSFSQRQVVKATLMRITLHAVTAADRGVFHAAMTPVLRASRLLDRRFVDTGLSIADADEAVPDLLEFLAEPRSTDEVRAHLADRVSDEPRLWWALKTYAPITHSPTDATWGFDRTTVVERADGDPVEYDEAIETLIARYLAGFGPARAVDVAQFTLLPMATIRPALEQMRDLLVTHTGADGSEVFDVVDAPPVPDADHPAPVRLLGMWDQILLAHRDRSRVIDDDIRSQVIRRNGDVLASVLVDGRVVGVWRCVDDGIEIATFRELDAGVWDGLDREASSLRASVADRDPRVFGRYDHWWDKLDNPLQRRVVAR